jgi:hypothetical protein
VVPGPALQRVAGLGTNIVHRVGRGHVPPRRGGERDASETSASNGGMEKAQGARRAGRV